MTLSVCMIVKNEAEMLKRNLPALSKHADEIVLVDTGSSDNSVEVAREFGAQVFHFAWINDFSAARNESLQHAASDWILWLDADEIMLEQDLLKLKELLKDLEEEKSLSLSIFECRVGEHEKKRGYKRVKLFRNGLGYHFVRPINEQLLDREGEIVKGQEVPVAIYHWGKHLAEERMNEKRKRYVGLYSEALKNKPRDAHLHFLLANNLKELKRNDKALKHYEQAVSFSGGSEIGKQALENKVNLLLRMRKLREAGQDSQRLLKLDPHSIAARNVMASIYLVVGKLDLAIAILTDALNIKLKGQINLYQTQAMPNFLLGKAYELKGEKKKAMACYAQARVISPEIMGVN